MMRKAWRVRWADGRALVCYEDASHARREARRLSGTLTYGPVPSGARIRRSNPTTSGRVDTRPKCSRCGVLPMAYENTGLCYSCATSDSRAREAEHVAQRRREIAAWRIVGRDKSRHIIADVKHDKMSTEAAVNAIRHNLRARSGKEWSVTNDRGTAYGWITVDVPPRIRASEPLRRAWRKELAQLMGLKSVDAYSGISIPAGYDYYREYIQRSAGRKPTAEGKQYWDNPTGALSLPVVALAAVVAWGAIETARRH